MTEAGEKWLEQIGINRSASDAEKTLRAFCDELEKRAKASYDADKRPLEETGAQSWAGLFTFHTEKAYLELKRELLRRQRGVIDG